MFEGKERLSKSNEIQNNRRTQNNLLWNEREKQVLLKATQAPVIENYGFKIRTQKKGEKSTF